MENTEQKKILIVEDDDAVRDGLKENLELEGYAVFISTDGTAGLQAYEQVQPDLVLLDVMMPGLDGLEVCRRIREFRRGTPVIMLTAKCAEIDKVVGLEMGADDYLTKPFAMRELFARIKALLRRCEVLNSRAQDGEPIGKSGEMQKLEFGAIAVDFRAYRAKKGEDEIPMSVKEFELLKFLAVNADHPVSRDQLLDNVWGYNSYPTTRTVDNFIARLRHKVEEVPDKPRHILTVHGIGYKFVY
ncbi:MAG: response regulator transcription factor [bacterium]|nr:response regulator transcription factor [bacterium]